jgi:hypothetical protein
VIVIGNAVGVGVGVGVGVEVAVGVGEGVAVISTVTTSTMGVGSIMEQAEIMKRMPSTTASLRVAEKLIAKFYLMGDWWDGNRIPQSWPRGNGMLIPSRPLNGKRSRTKVGVMIESPELRRVWKSALLLSERALCKAGFIRSEAQAPASSEF